MTVVCGNLEKKKKDVLSKGPKHKDGKTFSEIVNASANYWKHSSEWPLDKNCRDKGLWCMKTVGAVLPLVWCVLDFLGYRIGLGLSQMQ